MARILVLYDKWMRENAEEMWRTAFEEAGIFDPELARSYRENILAAGASEEPMVLYERFRGAAPDIQALLTRRGLL